MSEEVTADVGHCSECQLPMFLVNGKVENPTQDNSNIVLYFDYTETGRPRATWHYRTCEVVCTAWEDCGILNPNE